MLKMRTTTLAVAWMAFTLAFTGRVTASTDWLRGLDEKQWRAYDETWKTGSYTSYSARAHAPIIQGIWANNDGTDHLEDLLLALTYECLGYDQNGTWKIFSDLSVLWVRLHGSAGRYKASAVLPTLDWDATGVSGFTPYAVWETAIGSSSAWQKSIWDLARPNFVLMNTGEERMVSANSSMVFDFRGKDAAGYLGTEEGSDLTNGEVARLQKADFLMFRLPYKYYRSSDYSKSETGFRFPKKNAKLVRGYQEWHIPLAGSREAIESAQKVCRKELSP